MSTKAGQVHLDFGCGCGWLLRWWPRGPETRLYGCDYNLIGRSEFEFVGRREGRDHLVAQDVYLARRR